MNVFENQTSSLFWFRQGLEFEKWIPSFFLLHVQWSGSGLREKNFQNKIFSFYLLWYQNWLELSFHFHLMIIRPWTWFVVGSKTQIQMHSSDIFQGYMIICGLLKMAWKLKYYVYSNYSCSFMHFPMILFISLYPSCFNYFLIIFGYSCTMKTISNVH